MPILGAAYAPWNQKKRANWSVNVGWCGNLLTTYPNGKSNTISCADIGGFGYATEAAQGL